MKLNLSHIIILLFVFLISCGEGNNDFCLSNQMSVEVGLYSSYTSTESEDNDTSVTDIVIKGLFPEELDKLVIDTPNTVSSIFFPLSQHSDSTEFILELNQRREAIMFYHSKELNFISEECGFIFHFYIDSLRTTRNYFIDEVEFIDDEVIYNKNAENVKIYLF